MKLIVRLFNSVQHCSGHLRSSKPASRGDKEFNVGFRSRCLRPFGENDFGMYNFLQVKCHNSYCLQKCILFVPSKYTEMSSPKTCLVEGQYRRPWWGLRYLSLINIYSEHFSRSLCSLNHKILSFMCKTSDLYDTSLFLHKVGFCR